MEKKDYRKMNNEELQRWRENAGGAKSTNPGEEHRRAMYAMQNPVRREILLMLKDSALSIEEIARRLNIDKKNALYHLQFLQGIFYITIKEEIVDLTPPGVAYLRNAMT